MPRDDFGGWYPATPPKPLIPDLRSELRREMITAAVDRLRKNLILNGVAPERAKALATSGSV